MKHKILFYTVIFVLVVVVANMFSGNGKVYQLDLFSVISFGLAIAAFLLSMFAAWLSWEFYKKSTEALDLVHVSVSGIESSVAGVQSNITEIVQTAVKHWTQNAGVASEAIAGEAYESLKSDLEAVKTAAPEVEARINEVLSNFSREIASAKAHGIFPSGNFGVSAPGPVMRVNQTTIKDDPEALEGEVHFEILRPVRNASYKLRVKHNSESIKYLNLDLVAFPEGITGEQIRLRQGVDQHGSLNIHMVGTSPMPIGSYTVRFNAVYS